MGSDLEFIRESTSRVARVFQIASARVSQLRRELGVNWHQFVGERADPAEAAKYARP
jgi:hypothetical protein